MEDLYPSKNLGKYETRPAPADQYKKYMQKSENVFYEQRYEAKLAGCLKWLLRFVLLLTFLVVIGYIMVGSVTPYNGPAPENGYVRNKVIYCDFGYRLVANECVLDESFNLEAEELAIGVVTDLRMQYGEADCTGTVGYPSRNIRQQIEKNDQIEPRKALILQQQVHAFLSAENNKKDYRFDYDGSSIWPTEKLHSYTCRTKLLLESGVVWKGIFGALAVLVGAYMVYTWYEKEQLARRIYEHLKTRVCQSGTIKIDDEREAMEQIGHVDEKMWKRIDSIRTREQQIGFFEDDCISWRRI